MTLKKEGCSDFQLSVKIGCSKPVAHTALSYFTKRGIYRDGERTGHPRITSAIEDSLMIFFFGWLATF